MSYTKKMLKSRPVCKVRFKISSEEAAGNDAVYLAGTFNNWDEHNLPMKKNKDGSFALEIDLPAGERHLFRYLRADGVWINDSAADSYEPSPYCGEDNSVIQL